MESERRAGCFGRERPDALAAKGWALDRRGGKGRGTDELHLRRPERVGLKEVHYKRSPSTAGEGLRGTVCDCGSERFNPDCRLQCKLLIKKVLAKIEFESRGRHDYLCRPKDFRMALNRSKSGLRGCPARSRIMSNHFMQLRVINFGIMASVNWYALDKADFIYTSPSDVRAQPFF